jgi:selenocysteine-specific elongation factor
MLIGTAGHIDHGKTSLVKALTGVDADRLKEEKARGITLDLGYAFLPLPNGDVLGFVDVPGHERLVHNMLAGATGIDFVLLVIAADDGPMPQTREHLQLLELLGLNRGAVALTKIDVVSRERRAQAQAEIHALLEGTALADAPLFEVSNLGGEGIPELKQHLDAQAARTPARPVDGHFRLAVDRCFTLTGTGTVVTGTVHAGIVHVGDRLLVSPSGKEVRVRAIHAQNRPAEQGRAGQRCALNLAGIEKHEIQRGDWLVAPEVHVPSARFDARLRWVARDFRLKDGLPVHVHLAAGDALGRVTRLTAADAAGDELLAQVVLDKPAGALYGDRFVLRDQSDQHTLAGGIVLDPFAPARKRRSPARLAMLAALDRPESAEALASLLAASPHGVDIDAFVRARNLGKGSAAVLAAVPHALAGNLGFDPVSWARYREAVLRALTETHERSPELLGLNAAQLRRAAASTLPWAAFTHVIEELAADGGLVRRGQWLHRPGHKVALTAGEQKLWSQVSPLLEREPYQPPRVRDMARACNVGEALVRTLLQRQATLGDVYLVAHDHYFSRTAFARLLGIARELAASDEHGLVRAADFRNRIGTGRKLAIQILECFDRMGLSRRVGDTHFVHAHAGALVEEAAPHTLSTTIIAAAQNQQNLDRHEATPLSNNRAPPQ